MIRRNSHWFLLLSLAWAVGCGDEVRSSSPDDVSGNNPTVVITAGTLTVSEPPEPKKVFSDLNEALSVLHDSAVSRDSAQVIAAGNWISAQGSEAIDPLVDVINDETMPIRFRNAACRPLKLIGAPAQQALIEITYSEEPYTRRKATSALGDIEPVTPEVVDRLIELIDHEDEPTQFEAVRAIGDIGEEASAAAVRLDEFRRSLPEGRLRQQAYDALHKVEPRTGLQSLND